MTNILGDGFDDEPGDPEPDGPDDRCTRQDGHEWSFTGTGYGGDDPSYFGEGRCYCIHCGADGDA